MNTNVPFTVFFRLPQILKLFSLSKSAWWQGLSLNESQIGGFLTALDKVLGKRIDKLYLIPLHGRAYEFRTTDEPASCVREYKDDDASLPLVKYEIFVKYTNGNEIRSQFQEREESYTFLEYISKSIGS